VSKTSLYPKVAFAAEAVVLPQRYIPKNPGLWHDSNFGNESGNYLDRHPAGLVPEGRPYINTSERWLYFTWSRSSISGKGMDNQALIRRAFRASALCTLR
jgi:hypothetical protein